MKDYHKKSYTNPFFGAAKRRGGFRKHFGRRHSWRSKLIAFLFFVLLAGSIYFIFFSPYFSIKRVEISGLEKISYDEMCSMVDEQIASQRFFVFSQNNVFVFDEKELIKTLNDKYSLKFLRVGKSLPGVIKISLEEKKPALIWKTAEKFYLIDWDGIAIREIAETEVSGYPGNQPGAKMAVVFDDNNAPTAIKDEILPSEEVRAINDLQNNLPHTTRLLISNLSMANHNDSTIKIRVSEGWDIYFSLTSDLNVQITKLSAFMLEKNPEERRSLEYVDLRFEDRVYYK